MLALAIKGVLSSWYLELFCLLMKKNTKEIIINHKGTRMVKDGKD